MINCKINSMKTNKGLIDCLIDFKGMSTNRGLFYANCELFYLDFLYSFLRVFFLTWLYEIRYSYLMQIILK